MPTLFREATDEALAAHAATFDLLADEATWVGSEGEAADVATDMRAAAKLCAQNDRHEAAAWLLALAVRHCPVAAEDAAVVEEKCKVCSHEPTAAQRAALEAAHKLMRSRDNRRLPWPKTLLKLAEASGHELVAAIVAIAAGESMSVVQSSQSDEDATPKAVKGSALLSAAAAGDCEGVTVALEAGAAADDAMEHGLTPLMLAARAGSVSTVRLLLTKGANPNRSSRSECLALGLAAQAGETECVAALAEAGAEVDKPVLDEDGTTPLTAAAFIGDTAMVAVLLDKGAMVNKGRSRDGDTPLIAAAWQGHASIATALLDKGAMVDQTKDGGLTPLFIAAMRAQAPVVEVLLARGARVNKGRSRDGATPLFIAKILGNGERKLPGHADVVALLEAHKS